MPSSCHWGWICGLVSLHHVRLFIVVRHFVTYNSIVLPYQSANEFVLVFDESRPLVCALPVPKFRC